MKTLSSLLKCKEVSTHDLVVFSDGPKNDYTNKQVESVRSLLNSITGFNSVKIITNPVNKGLASSIISGVTKVLKDYESIIVLEDDMVVSPYFLTYMNDGLEKYQNDDRVISIHGYVYPVDQELPETFFLKGANCWGWATWRRGWNLFNPDGQYLFDKIKRNNLSKQFNFNNSFDYMKMLCDQINGLNDSWAIRWYASAFTANKLTLYPGKSFVHNIGFDSSGTHCRSTTSRFDVLLNNSYSGLETVNVVESSQAVKSFEGYFLSSKTISSRWIPYFISKAFNKVRILFKD